MTLRAADGSKEPKSLGSRTHNQELQGDLFVANSVFGDELVRENRPAAPASVWFAAIPLKEV